MTRALSSRSSKRKQKENPSQEIIPEDCKENSPSLLSQSSARKLSANKKVPIALKENISPNEISSRLVQSSFGTTKEFRSPIRSSKRLNSVLSTNKNKTAKTQTERNVLGDKTNSGKVQGKKSSKKTCDVLRTIENKNSIAHKIISIPKSDLTVQSCLHKDNVSHVPIYQCINSQETSEDNEVALHAKQDAVYEFEVDENEEPVQKKKRKKRAYTRKPKTGPKALTINNIKYSSTESLVSLPEKPIVQQKRATKGNKAKLKPYSSVTSLNENEMTCYSVKSFMSQPPSMILCENQNIRSKKELSILQETESEHCQSPNQHFDVNVVVDIHADPSINDSHQRSTHVSDHTTTSSAHTTAPPQCYSSKTHDSTKHHSNLHNTIHQRTSTSLHQMSSFSPNISLLSAHDFLSSTPCKRSPLVVCNNSVFDDSYDLPPGLRPSTGLIRDTTAAVLNPNENCFGFDEPEELEEPLVSPIKNRLNLKPKKLVKLKYLGPKTVDEPKPSTQEIIEMLKATIPKTGSKKEPSEVFDTSVENYTEGRVPTPDKICKETSVNFMKPPRRSYERQRRVRHYSEHVDTEEENTDAEETEVVKEVANKCYKKKVNTTKTAKPKKITKGQQRIAKEEDELERFAAQMNAQFQEIDKVNLVVE